MRITLEFGNAEKFFTELPKFGKVIELASQYVDFQHVDKDGRDINIMPKEASAAVAPQDVAAPVTPAATSAPVAPPAEEKKAPENTKSEISEGKEKPAEIMPKPVEGDAVDIAACRKVLHAKIKAGYRDEMKALLAKLGAENVSTLNPEKYSEFVSEAGKIGGDGNA